jgi:hypothetical protein
MAGFHSLWREYFDVAVDADSRLLEDFAHFPEGTLQQEVLDWFSLSREALLQSSSEMPVLAADPDFKCEVCEWPGRLVGHHRLKEYIEEDLDALGYGSEGWSTLFAYMHRRFGLPHVGGDDYKDLSAGWRLTTPDASVFVWVSPSVVSPRFGFSAMVLVGKGEREAPETMVETARLAARATLRDLLRPVCVRDSHINAHGLVDDEDMFGADQADEEADEDAPTLEVEFAPTSGLPMPLGVFGGAGWQPLLSLAGHYGQGDLGRGIEVIAERMRAQALEGLAEEVPAVRALVRGSCMLLAHGEESVAILRALPDDNGVLADAIVVRDGLQAMWSRDKPECDAATESLPNRDDPDVGVAQGYLDLLGSKMQLKRHIHGAVTEARQRTCWKELVEHAEGDQEGVLDALVARYGTVKVYDAMPSTHDILSCIEPGCAPGIMAWVRKWQPRGQSGLMGMDYVQLGLMNALLNIRKEQDREAAVSPQPDDVASP